MTAINPVLIATGSQTRVRERDSSRARQAIWFVAGLVVFFMVPWLGTDVGNLNHDLYYLVYFTVAMLFLGRYVIATGVDAVKLVRRRWRSSVLIGLAATAFVVANVLRADATDRPTGAYLFFELAWRGLAYGTVDALILSVFPCLIAYGLMKHDLSTVARKAAFAGLATVLIWTIAATYHLGYDQYRSSEIIGPEIGNTAISVPMIATLNPVGAILAHTAMHVTANIHAYETDVFLPPRTLAP